MTVRGFTCRECGCPAVMTGTTNRYCPQCSERRDLRRKGITLKEKRERIQSRTTANGIALSDRQRSNIGHAFFSPHLLWAVRVSIPFSYAASKNHIYSLAARGHQYLRGESKAMRSALTLSLKTAMAGQRVANNKVWISIFVQKPNHKGDAINVIDLVCDAVKDAIPVDDRWFCIRQLDWQIVKSDPELYVEIAQTSDVDCQVCSSCGRIQPFAAFGKKTRAKHGIDRNCKDCRYGRVGSTDAEGEDSREGFPPAGVEGAEPPRNEAAE